ncbi:hypothetical protein ABZ570_26760 [Micromonospora sp. NPDC007271]|uniref:hypothetical protein n=1 Tax=Micromonospora sp. NPDC007271 TaxID=3154587 RepID=UPI0033F5F46A
MVVVTSFACQSIPKMLLIWKLHHQLKRRVYQKAADFLGVHLILDWPNRTVRSISLWRRVHGIYDMGEVPEHVEATRIPAQHGIRTRCGVFSYDGDWLAVLFGARDVRPSPLSDWPGRSDLYLGKQKERRHVQNSH